MILPALFKLTNGNKIQIWTVEVEENKHRVISGQIDGKKVTSEWTICQGKNIGRSNQTTPNQQAIKEAQAMWEKKVSGGYFQELVQAETGEKKFYAPMLAKEFDPNTFTAKKVFVQPKLDGLRCVISKEGMFSRNGKEFISCPHIFDELKHLFVENPDLVLDGELYNHIYHDNFNQIISLVKKTKPTRSDITESAKYVQYWCYDILSMEEAIYSERYEFLNKNIFNVEYKSCFLLRTDDANSLDEIDTIRGEYVEEGFEGQMVRYDMPYEVGKRSKYLLKNKTFQDAEFEILDIVEGVGNKSGMAGFMVVKNVDGSTFKSNIKGDRDYCRMLLETKENFIGKLATIKFFNLTPDGVPRFPYVIKIDRNSYE
jgi:DNA ligase-1